MSIHSVEDLLVVFQRRCCADSIHTNPKQNTKKSVNGELDRKQTESLRKLVREGFRSGSK